MLIWPEKEGLSHSDQALRILEGGDASTPTSSFGSRRSTISSPLPPGPTVPTRPCTPQHGLRRPYPDAQLLRHSRRRPRPPVHPQRRGSSSSSPTRLQRVQLSRTQSLVADVILTGLSDDGSSSSSRCITPSAIGLHVATLAAFSTCPDPPRSARHPDSGALFSTGELFQDDLRRRLRNSTVCSLRWRSPSPQAGILGSWPRYRAVSRMASPTDQREPQDQIGPPARRRSTIPRSAKQIAHAHHDGQRCAADGCRTVRRPVQQARQAIRWRDLAAPSCPSRCTRTARRGAGEHGRRMLVPLPIGQRDDVRRLELVAAETSERKRRADPRRRHVPDRAPAAHVLRLMPRQRFMNACVANVPGPQIPLYSRFGVAPRDLPDRTNHGEHLDRRRRALLCRRFNVTIVADRDLCPDLEVFVAGLQRSLEGSSAR